MREIKYRGFENGKKVYGTNREITDETGEQYRYSLSAFFSLVQNGFITNVTEYTEQKELEKRYREEVSVLNMLVNAYSSEIDDETDAVIDRLFDYIKSPYENIELSETEQCK